MRTTLKRGVGRGHAGNGKIQLPPEPAGLVTLYRQPPPPPRPGRSLALTILGWASVAVIVCTVGVAGGAYLYLHQSVAAVAPSSADVKATAKRLDLPIAGEPATALVIGYDRRADDPKDLPARSDTLMLMRADPKQQTISLLSFPRDLRAEIVCPGQGTYVTKINAAYADCGAQGALETVRRLTGARINYLITVNFRGFTQVVDKLGGIWMDIDHRYLNTVSGPTGYATINLQPGYQQLNGYQALDFVRFRHTDSDLYRNARQQSFVRAFKDEIRTSFSLTKLPKLIKVLTSNIEVAQGGGQNVSAKTVLSYAVLAYSLPPGHVFQSRIEGLEGSSDLTTSSQNIATAVQQWANPDVESPKKATAVALGEKVKATAVSAKDTTVTVLNGNGVTGSASNAGYLLGAAGISDPDAAQRHSGERADVRLLPDEDLLRSESGRGQGGGESGCGPVRVGGHAGDDARDIGALERRHADGGRGTDVPRDARVGAGRPDTPGGAGQRRAGDGGVTGASARAAAEGRFPADGADGGRAVVVDRSRAAGSVVPVQG